MGDAGEGLIDAEARIQERLDEIAEARRDKREAGVRNPEAQRELESLRLARVELQRQLDATPHEQRRRVLRDALTELDRRTDQVRASLGEVTPKKKSRRS